MSRIKSGNTKPEMIVRSLLHRMGYRFRLHRKDLPGKPDIVLPKYKTLIFVHGCFWHMHKGCKRSNIPKTNKEYWGPKLKRNKENDEKNKKKLLKCGWKVITVWECKVKDLDKLVKFLKRNIQGINNG